MKRILTGLAALAALGLAAGAPASAAEVVLKSQSAMATNLLYTKAFRQHFVAPVNQAGKGVVRIDYLGGPEVTPARKAAAALKRGVFDVLYSPAGYYAGTVPEGFAIHAAKKSPAEIRKNGGLDLLNSIWAKKLNARILSWAISETRFNIYLSKKPIIGADGMVSLKGMKIRTSPTYRPLLTGLGAVTVRMKVSELYTALQRGVVQGTGWPNVGISKLGLGKLMKYRIEPSFYRANHLVLINLDRWKALPKAARAILGKEGEAFETSSVAYMAAQTVEDEKALKAQGLQSIRLTGAAEKKYTAIANDGLWKRLAERKVDVKALRAKLD